MAHLEAAQAEEGVHHYQRLNITGMSTRKLALIPPGQAPPPPPGSWSCATCTFLNGAENANCMMCTSLKCVASTTDAGAADAGAVDAGAPSAPSAPPLIPERKEDAAPPSCASGAVVPPASGAPTPAAVAAPSEAKDGRAVHHHGTAPAAAAADAAAPVLTEAQLIFFRAYGFLVLKGVVPQETVKCAREKAEAMIREDIDERRKKDRVWAFGGLPEGSRSTWANCMAPELRAVFTGSVNTRLCEQMVGGYTFEHHKGVGSVTFAPRFQAWRGNPPGEDFPEAPHVAGITKAIRAGHLRATPRYALGSLSEEFKELPKWSREFLKAADALGASFAPCTDGNWHIDGWDCNSIAGFNLIWGTFLTPLPAGHLGNLIVYPGACVQSVLQPMFSHYQPCSNLCSNLGSLIVYPGTHHAIAEILHHTGAKKSFWFDAKKGQKAPDQKALPSLARKGLADGKPYEVLCQPGDVAIMHPWLAHGIGMNTSESPRLAVYVRLHANDHGKVRVFSLCAPNLCSVIIQTHALTYYVRIVTTTMWEDAPEDEEKAGRRRLEGQSMDRRHVSSYPGGAVK